jgi:predicted ArsR family transcriptional regulator
MDRLPVFKALGDNTRYAIYLELARAPAPLATSDIAEALGLHPNTVRPHLERMREVGLLEIEIDNKGVVGRPQHRYSVAADAPSLGLEPSAVRLLAALLAGVADSAGAGAELAAEVGRAQGEEAAAKQPAKSCLQAVMAELTDLGYDPVAAGDGISTSIAFTHCPFQELAEAFPHLVCHLHRGIVEGLVAAKGGAEVTRFNTLDDREPCQVHLTAR